MKLHPFGPDSQPKQASMPLIENPADVGPYRVGLSTETVLRGPALDIAAAAIALGRSRHTEWSDSDDTLDRVLRYLKRDWESR